MAPNPQCAAVAAAKERTGLTYAKIAEKLGTTEQHIIDICSGASSPTKDEFDSLAKVLSITSPDEHKQQVTK